MLASLVDAPLNDPHLAYEPKYDGIRAIVEIGPRGVVRLWSRLGNEKTRQFPEIAAALGQWARKRAEPLVLDGEIVALDAKGEPTGFQQLQGRIHLLDVAAPKGKRSHLSTPTRPSSPSSRVHRVRRAARRPHRPARSPVAERRTALERVFAKTGSSLLRISDVVRGDARRLYKDAPSVDGKGSSPNIRTHSTSRASGHPDWRKLKIVHEQEFVIGGWTEPRQTRTYFGALLLGSTTATSSSMSATLARASTSGSSRA
jgi:bifunctional non-homologous end joining protein LigD